MIRSVIKKLERHLKEEMILALHDFREDTKNTEEDGASEEPDCMGQAV